MSQTVRVVDPGTLSIPNVVCRLTSITSDAKLLYGVLDHCFSCGRDMPFERMAAWTGLPVENIGPLLDELHNEGLIDVQILDGFDRISLKHHPCFNAQEIPTEVLEQEK